MAMKPEIKDQWVKALRSGDYKQTIGVLNRVIANEWGSEGYCCLGVLCDLAVKAGVISEPVIRGHKAVYDGFADIDLPPSVQAWSGIEDGIDHRVSDVGVINDLIGFNDDGKDFAYIADVIEARL